MRGGHRGALIEFKAVAARIRITCVQGRQNASASTRCCHVHHRTIVRIIGSGTGTIGGCHRDHSCAVSRSRVGRIGALIATRNDYRRAQGTGGVDRCLSGGGPTPATAEGEVEDLGWVSVRGHAADSATRGPDYPIGDVRHMAPAATKRPHRHYTGTKCGTRNAGSVVGLSGDGARHMGARATTNQRPVIQRSTDLRSPSRLDPRHHNHHRLHSVLCPRINFS